MNVHDDISETFGNELINEYNKIVIEMNILKKIYSEIPYLTLIF